MAGPVPGGLLFDLKGDYVAAFTVAVSLVLVTREMLTGILERIVRLRLAPG